MTAKTDYLETAILNHIRGGAALSQPAGLYLALFTTSTNDAGGGTEATGNGYARQAVTLGAPSGNQSANTNTPTFTASGGSIGPVTHGAIHDAVSGGNMLYHGALGASKTIASGESLEFPPGSVTITED